MIKAFIPQNDTEELIANTYVLGIDDKSCVIVDLGNPTDRVYDYVSANFKKVSAILLTHGHYDHVRGVDRFLSHYNEKIPVYLGEDDYMMLEDPSLSLASMEHGSVSFDPTLLKDGMTLRFKDTEIKVIATPFHTMGSVCYLDEEDNALFTGDTLFMNSVGRTDLLGGDESYMIPSLSKLKALNDMLVVYPGHGKITNLRNEKANNPFLK